MKTKLTSEFDGVVKVEDLPVHYSILPDGRRILVPKSDQTHLNEIITPRSSGIIKFRDTNGNQQMGMDIERFPDAIAAHIQAHPVENLESYIPWLIFKALFVLGLVVFLTSGASEIQRANLKSLLRDTVK